MHFKTNSIPDSFVLNFLVKSNNLNKNKYKNLRQNCHSGGRRLKLLHVHEGEFITFLITWNI